MSISQSANPIEQKAVAIVERKLPVRILTATEYEAVAEDFKASKALLKEIADHHDPIIASAHKTHKLACDAKKKLETPLMERANVANRLLGDFRAEQQRKAQEQERQRRAELERLELLKRQQEAAEQQKLAAQAAADEERHRNDAEAALALANEAFAGYDGPNADELQAEAQRSADSALRSAQEREEAERLARDIAEAPVVVPMVRVEADVPKVEGLTGRRTWFAEVTDKRKYLQHVLNNFARYENTIEIVMVSLNRTATNVKKEIEIEPGVMARPKDGAAVRS